MNVLLAKLLSSVGFIVTSIVGASLGFFAKSTTRFNSAITIAHCLAAGSLLSLWIFHILPEQAVEISKTEFGFYSGSFFYSYSYIITYLGFLLMLLVKTEMSGSIEDTSNLPVTLSTDSNNHNGSNMKNSQSENSTPVIIIKQKSSVKNNNFNPTYISFLLFGLGLAMHSFFEGFAVGNSTSANEILITTGGLLVHKWIETFLLVVNFHYHHKRNSWVLWSTLTIASISSPLGVFFDSILSDTSDIVPLAFESLSSGIILYIAVEILFDSLQNKNISKTYKLLSILSGSAIILLFLILSTYLEGESTEIS